MIRRKRKLKIKTLDKSYSLNDSALFRVTTKKKLASILFVDIAALRNLLSDDNYNCFEDNKSGKPREIEHPFYVLDKVHTRIASLLCRIQQPKYIHSGHRNRSHVSNANVHIGHHAVLATDIQAFFPSTTRKMVFDFFHKQMECSPDVADILSHLCTCKGHIPTGSRISMPLAFWANQQMFGSLQKISCDKDIRMTVFVDDITFSGNKVTRQFKQQVKKIIERHGHTMHPKKTRIYKPDTVKVITGVAVDSDGVSVTNKQHKKIFEDMLHWSITKDIYLMPALNCRLLGRINSQSLIDRRYKDKARTLKNAIRNSKASNVLE